MFSFGRSSTSKPKDSSEVSKSRRKGDDDDNVSTVSRRKSRNESSTSLAKPRRKSSRRNDDDELESTYQSSTSKHRRSETAPSDSTTYGTVQPRGGDSDDRALARRGTDYRFDYEDSDARNTRLANDRSVASRRADRESDYDEREPARDVRRYRVSENNDKALVLSQGNGSSNAYNDREDGVTQRRRTNDDYDDRSEDRKASRKESKTSKGDTRANTDQQSDRRRTSTRSDNDAPRRKSSGRQDSSRAVNNHDAALPQNQCFSDPSTYTAPYRPPSMGLAADYYGDQGESVQFQPGVRPQGPAYVVNQEQLHLQTPTADAKPPPEPSANGQPGAAANYFTMNSASEAENTTPLRPSKPGQKPPKIKPSPRSSPRPNGRPSQNGSSFSPLAAAAIGTGAGAAMEYFNSSDNHSTSQHNNQQSYTTQQSAQFHNGAQTQEPSDMYGADTRPTRINQNSSSGPADGTAAAMGLAGAAAGAYMAHEHHDSHSGHAHQQATNGSGTYQVGYNQSAFPGMQQQKLRRKRTGPLGKFANWWNAPQDVAQFEEYTEFIGVCRYCFDPNAEPGHGPRKHHYHRGVRRQSSRYGSNLRVDKTYRHSSSDDDRKKSSRAKKAAAVGLAGLGAAKLGETLYNSKHGFDDTYSVKSGRPIAQQRTSYSRRDDYGVQNRHASREDLHLSRKSSQGRLDRRREDYNGSGRRRQSSTSSVEGLSRGNVASVAVGAAALGAAAEVAHRRRSRSRSKERPPGRQKYYSKRVSPQHSYVDLTATQQGTTGFGSFFSSPSANQKKGKKTKGIFAFSNASTSSSDADLAFGEGTIRRQNSTRSNSKRDRRKQDKYGGNDTAAIMGLAAAGAALAAESGRKGKEKKYADRRTDNRKIHLADHESTIDENDDIWEDASDDESANDVDMALAYGGKLSANQSKESLASQSSGTGKWDWRWNKNKKEREEKKLRRRQSMEAANKVQDIHQQRPVLSVIQPAEPQMPGSFESPFDGRSSSQLNPFAMAAAGAGIGALAASRMDMPNDPSPASRPMQYMDPMPVSDHTTPNGSARITPQPTNVVMGRDVPLQQPQPTSPTLSHAARLESAAMYDPVIVRPDEYPVVKREVRPREDFESREYSSVTPPRRNSSPDLAAYNAPTLSKQSVSWALTPEQLDNEKRVHEKEERRRRKRDKEERRRTTDVADLQRQAEEEQYCKEDATGTTSFDASRPQSTRRALVGETSRTEADIDAEIRQLHMEQKRKKELRKRQQFEDEQRQKQLNRHSEADVYERDDRSHKPLASDVATAAMAAGVGVAAVAALSSTKEQPKSQKDNQRAEPRKKRRSVDDTKSSRTEFDLPNEADPVQETAQQRLARRAARNVSRSPSPVHDDYKTFFLPQEIAETVEEHNRAAQHREDAVPSIVDIVPVSRSSLSSGRRRTPFDDDLYEIYGLDASHRDPLSLPWKVPRLGLVEPTPPGSRTVSERDPHSPMVVAAPQTIDAEVEKDVEPIGEPLTRKRSSSRVTFGMHDTWVYEERTPEYERADPVATLEKSDEPQRDSKESSKNASPEPETFYTDAEPRRESSSVGQEYYRPRPERLYTLDDDAEEAVFLHKQSSDDFAPTTTGQYTQLPVIQEPVQEDHPPDENIASNEPTLLDERDLADFLGAKAFYHSPFAQTVSDVDVQAVQADRPGLNRVETLPDETPQQEALTNNKSYFDETTSEASRPSRSEARRAERASSQDKRDMSAQPVSADVDRNTTSFETSEPAVNKDGSRHTEREASPKPNPALRNAFMNVAAAAAAASTPKNRDLGSLPTAEPVAPKVAEVDVFAPRPASQARRERSSSLTSKVNGKTDSVFDYLASSSSDDKNKPQRARSEVGGTSKAAMIAAASAAVASIGARQTEHNEADPEEGRDPRRSLPNLKSDTRGERGDGNRRSSTGTPVVMKEQVASPELPDTTTAEPETYLPEVQPSNVVPQTEADFYAAGTDKPKKRKSKRGSEIFDDFNTSKSMTSLPGSQDEESKSRRRSKRQSENDDGDVRSVASTSILRDDERKSRRKSKRDADGSDDDARSIASVPVDEEKSRRKSKRSSKVYDDEDDDTRSVKSSSSKKDRREKEERKSGGFFSNMFSSSKVDVSTPKRKDSKSSRSEIGRKDDSEDDSKRRKKRSSKSSASASVPDLSRPPTDYDLSPVSSRRRTETDLGVEARDRSTDDGFVSAQDEQSFLAERPEMPLPTATKDVSTGTDGVSGLTQGEVRVSQQHMGKEEGSTVPEENYYTSGVNPEHKNIAPANEHEDGPTIDDLLNNRPRALSAIHPEQFDPVAAAAVVDSGEETAFEISEKEPTVRPRTQSVIHLAGQSNEQAPSPTSKRVPLFKRLPITPRTGTKESASSPILAPTSPLTSKFRQNRPKSTEFTSKEFRPLYLVERHTPVKAETPILEDISMLPSLPSSRSTSVAGSTDDLTRLAHGSLSDSETEDKRGRENRRRSWSGGDATLATEVLDSRSATPVPGERQRAREQQQQSDQVPFRGRRELPKHLFHSPSELLQDPAFFVGLDEDDIVPRSASPLPSVVSTVDEHEQEFMSAESRPDTPVADEHISQTQAIEADRDSSHLARRTSSFTTFPKGFADVSPSHPLSRTNSAEHSLPERSLSKTPPRGVSPPSRSQSTSPFKHRTSSGISARAAALLGGTALGLAIGGAASEARKGENVSLDPHSSEAEESRTIANEVARHPSISVTEPTPTENRKQVSLEDGSEPKDAVGGQRGMDPAVGPAGDLQRVSEPTHDLASTDELPHLLRDQVDEVMHILEDEAVPASRQPAEVGDVGDIAIEHSRSWDPTTGDRAHHEEEAKFSVDNLEQYSAPAQLTGHERIEPYVPTQEDIDRAYHDHSAFELAFAKAVQARGLTEDTTRSEALESFLPKRNNAPFVPKDNLSPIAGSAASSMVNTPVHSPDDDRSVSESPAAEHEAEPSFAMQLAGKKTSKKDKKKSKKEKQKTPQSRLSQEFAPILEGDEQDEDLKGASIESQDVPPAELEKALHEEVARRLSSDVAEPAENLANISLSDEVAHVEARVAASNEADLTLSQNIVDEPEDTWGTPSRKEKKSKKGKQKMATEDLLGPALAAAGTAAFGAAVLYSEGSEDAINAGPNDAEIVERADETASRDLDTNAGADVAEASNERQDPVEDQKPWDYGLSDKQAKKRKKEMQKLGTWDDRVTQEAIDIAVAQNSAAMEKPTAVDYINQHEEQQTTSEPVISGQEEIEEEKAWDYGLTSKQAKKKEKDMRRSGTWDDRVTQEDIDAKLSTLGEARSHEVDQPIHAAKPVEDTVEELAEPQTISDLSEEPVELIAWDAGLSSKQAKKKEKEMKRQGIWDDRVTQEMVDEAADTKQGESEIPPNELLPETDDFTAGISSPSNVVVAQLTTTTDVTTPTIVEKGTDPTDKVTESAVARDIMPEDNGIQETQVPDVVLDLLNRRRTDSNSATIVERESDDATVSANLSSTITEHPESAEPMAAGLEQEKDDMSIEAASADIRVPPVDHLGSRVEHEASSGENDTIQTAVDKSVDDTSAITEDDTWASSSSKSRKKDKKKRKSTIDWTVERDAIKSNMTQPSDEGVKSEPSAIIDREADTENLSEPMLASSDAGPADKTDTTDDTGFASSSSSKKSKKDKKKAKKQKSMSEDTLEATARPDEEIDIFQRPSTEITRSHDLEKSTDPAAQPQLSQAEPVSETSNEQQIADDEVRKPIDKSVLTDLVAEDDDKHSLDVNLGRAPADVTEVDDNASTFVNTDRSIQNEAQPIISHDRSIGEAMVPIEHENESVVDLAEPEATAIGKEKQHGPGDDWTDTQTSELQQQGYDDPTVDDFFDAPKSPRDSDDTSWLKGNKKGKKGKKSKHGSTAGSSSASESELLAMAAASEQQNADVQRVQETQQSLVAKESMTADNEPSVTVNEAPTARLDDPIDFQQSARAIEHEAYPVDESAALPTPFEENPVDPFSVPLSRSSSKKNKKRKSVIWADADSVPGTPANESGLELIVPPSPERVYKDDVQAGVTPNPEQADGSRKERNIGFVDGAENSLPASEDSTLEPEATTEDEWSVPVSFGKKSKKEKKKNKKGSKSDSIGELENIDADLQPPADVSNTSTMLPEQPIEVADVSQAAGGEAAEDDEWAVSSKKSKKDKKKKKRGSYTPFDEEDGTSTANVNEQQVEKASIARSTDDIHESPDVTKPPQADQAQSNANPVFEPEALLDDPTNSSEKLASAELPDSTTVDISANEPEDFYRTVSNDPMIHQFPTTAMALPSFPSDFTTGQHFASSHNSFASHGSPAPQESYLPIGSHMQSLSPTRQPEEREAPSPGQQAAEDWYRTSPVMHHADPARPHESGAQADVEVPAASIDVAEASIMPEHVEETQDQRDERPEETLVSGKSHSFSNEPLADSPAVADDEWSTPLKKSKKDKKDKKKKSRSQPTIFDSEEADTVPSIDTGEVSISRSQLGDDSQVLQRDVESSNQTTSVPDEESMLAQEETVADDEWTATPTMKRGKKNKKSSKSETFGLETPVDTIESQAIAAKSPIVVDEPVAADEDEWSTPGFSKKSKKDKKKKRGSAVEPDRPSTAVIDELDTMGENKPNVYDEMPVHDNATGIQMVKDISADEPLHAQVDETNVEAADKDKAESDVVPLDISATVKDQLTADQETPYYAADVEQDSTEADDSEWLAPSSNKKSKKDKKKRKQSIALEQPTDEAIQPIDTIDLENAIYTPLPTEAEAQNEVASDSQEPELAREPVNTLELTEQPTVTAAEPTVADEQQTVDDEWASFPSSKKSKKDKKKKKSLQTHEPLQEVSPSENVTEPATLTEEPISTVSEDLAVTAVNEAPVAVEQADEGDWAMPSSSKKKKDKNNKRKSVSTAEEGNEDTREQPHQLEVETSSSREPQKAEEPLTRSQESTDLDKAEADTFEDAQEDNDKFEDAATVNEPEIQVGESVSHVDNAAREEHVEETVPNAHDIGSSTAVHENKDAATSSAGVNHDVVVSVTEVPSDEVTTEPEARKVSSLEDAEHIELSEPAETSFPEAREVEDDEWSTPSTSKKSKKDKKKKRKSGIDDLSDEVMQQPEPVPEAVLDGPSNTFDLADHEDNDKSVPQQVVRDMPFEELGTTQAEDEDEWAMPSSSKKSKKDKKKKKKKQSTALEPSLHANVSSAADELSMPQATVVDEFANTGAEPALEVQTTETAVILERELDGLEESHRLTSQASTHDDIAQAAADPAEDAWGFSTSTKKSKKDKKKRKNTASELSEPSTPATEQVDAFEQQPTEEEAVPIVANESATEPISSVEQETVGEDDDIIMRGENEAEVIHRVEDANDDVPLEAHPIPVDTKQTIETEPEMIGEQEWSFTPKKSKKDKEKKRQATDTAVNEESSIATADSGFATPAEELETSTTANIVPEPETAEQVEIKGETAPLDDDWTVPATSSKKSKEDKKKKRLSVLQDEPDTSSTEPQERSVPLEAEIEASSLVPEAASKSGEGAMEIAEVANQPEELRRLSDPMDIDQAAFLAQATAVTDHVAAKYGRGLSSQSGDGQQEELSQSVEPHEWSIPTSTLDQNDEEGKTSHAQSSMEDTEGAGWVAPATAPETVEVIPTTDEPLDSATRLVEESPAPETVADPRHVEAEAEDEWASFSTTKKSKKDKKKNKRSQAVSEITEDDVPREQDSQSARELESENVTEVFVADSERETQFTPSEPTTVNKSLDIVEPQLPSVETDSQDLGQTSTMVTPAEEPEDWYTSTSSKKSKKDKKKKNKKGTTYEDEASLPQAPIETSTTNVVEQAMPVDNLPRSRTPSITQQPHVEPARLSSAFDNDANMEDTDPHILPDDNLAEQDSTNLELAESLNRSMHEPEPVLTAEPRETVAEEVDEWTVPTKKSKKDKRKRKSMVDVQTEEPEPSHVPVNQVADTADQPSHTFDTVPLDPAGADTTIAESFQDEPKTAVEQEKSFRDLPVNPVSVEGLDEQPADDEWATSGKKVKKAKKKSRKSTIVETEPQQYESVTKDEVITSQMEDFVNEPVQIDQPELPGPVAHALETTRDVTEDPVSIAPTEAEDEWNVPLSAKKSKKEKKKNRKSTVTEPEVQQDEPTANSEVIAPGIDNLAGEPISVDHPELPATVAHVLEISRAGMDEPMSAEAVEAEDEWTQPALAKKSKKDKKKRKAVQDEEDTQTLPSQEPELPVTREGPTLEQIDIPEAARSMENIHVESETGPSDKAIIGEERAVPSRKQSKKDKKKQKNSTTDILEPAEPSREHQVEEPVESGLTADGSFTDDAPMAEPQAEDFYRTFTPAQDHRPFENQSIARSETVDRAITPSQDITMRETDFDVRSPEAEAYSKSAFDDTDVHMATPAEEVQTEASLSRKSSEKSKDKKKRKSEIDVYDTIEPEPTRSELESSHGSDTRIPRKASEEWTTQPMQIENAQMVEDSDGSQVSDTTRERRRRRRSPRLTAEHDPDDLPRNRALTPPPDHDDLMDTALGIAAGLGLGAAAVAGHSTENGEHERQLQPSTAPSSWSFANIDQPHQSVRDTGIHLDSPREGQHAFTRERDSGFPVSPQFGHSHGKQSAHGDSEASLRPPRPESPGSPSDVSPIVDIATPHRRQKSELEPTSKDRDSVLFNSSPAIAESARSVAPEFAHLRTSSIGGPKTPTGTSLARSGSSSGHRRVSPSLRMVRDSQGNLRESTASPTSLRSKKDSYGNLRAVAGSPLSPRSNKSEELASNLLDRVNTREVDRQAFSPSPRQSTDRPFSPRHSSLGTIDENTGVALGAAALGLAGGAALMSRESGRGSMSKSRTSSLRNLRQLSSTPSSSQQQTRQITDGPAGERSLSMSDSYDGYGAAPASPASPSRPPSLRKRQSLNQVLDLQARVEQLASENRALAEQKLLAERHIEELSLEHSKGDFATQEALQTVNEQLRLRDEEITRLRTEIQTIAATRDALRDEHENKYTLLLNEKDSAHAKLQETSRDLEQLRGQHESISREVEGVVAAQVGTAVAAKTNDLEGALATKDAELQQLRRELDVARAKIRDLQSKILARGVDEVVVVRDEDYFDNACQQLCQHVQQWVLRFSKFSDTRVCRATSEVRDEKIVDRFDNAILDGSDVDLYLGDRVKRRDVFMSVVMTMIWEFVFTRYLFGMDRDQRQKLKQLEKNLAEVGPASAVQQWRALTLTLLAKRQAFRTQKDADTDAVATEILQTLSKFLPPPQNLEQQIFDSLKNVMRSAIKLSIEMRTQKAEYIMLPPLQPEYDTNGDLARKVFFNASLMNERSGETSSNDELEAQQAVVRMVLFPLVVKKGGDEGGGDDEIVVCPAQVLIARPEKGKKSRRSGERERAQSRMSQAAMASTHSLGAMSGVEGNMI